MQNIHTDGQCVKHLLSKVLLFSLFFYGHTIEEIIAAYQRQNRKHKIFNETHKNKAQYK